MGTPKRADPRVLATESVRQRASAISESMSPADIDQLAGLLEIELDAVRRTSNPDVHARATQVKVTVPGNLEALVRDYEESTVFAKFGDWRWEREQEEIQRLVGLLRDPLQATAWWLNHSDEISAHQLAEKEIPTLRTVAETFVQVSNVLCHSGEVLGDAYQPMSVADVVARLWTEVDPVARSGLHDVLIEYAEQQNQQAIVEALQDLQS
ncbi:hypothetical protein [Stackebrandtia soli]|uniref:hypothetical protein n=1 Tax=Stackebrandtia soli TaxID=1892856 RepID=UPI0039E81437